MTAVDVETVLFDLDDTLCRYRRTGDELLEVAFERTGLDAALSALEDLPLGVVTNGAPKMQSAKLAGLGLGDAFDVVVHAGYDAPAKPSPAPFREALSALDARPERTYHVGNSLSSDVAGARAAGVGAVWLTGEEPAAASDEEPDPNPDPEPEPDHAVATLAELPGVLGR